MQIWHKDCTINTRQQTKYSKSSSKIQQIGATLATGNTKIKAFPGGFLLLETLTAKLQIFTDRNPNAD